MTDFKKEISKILVKWSMPTRQVAINEIVRLIEKSGLSRTEEEYKEAWMKGYNTAMQKDLHDKEFMNAFKNWLFGQFEAKKEDY